MATGTGKTLVFIETIFQIYKKYKKIKRHRDENQIIKWANKFIVLVPRVAILEHVKKNFENYIKENNKTSDVNLYSYESNIHEIIKFSEDEKLSILLITPQSINQNGNIINQPNENCEMSLFSSKDHNRNITPLHLIKSCNPILIVDEAHMNGLEEKEEEKEKSKTSKAVEKINPLVQISYSATFSKDSKEKIIYEYEMRQAYKDGTIKKAVFDYEEEKSGEKIESRIALTLEKHKEKKEQLLKKNIKVLSLFFTTSDDSAINDFDEKILPIFKKQYRKIFNEKLKDERKSVVKAGSDEILENEQYIAYFSNGKNKKNQEIRDTLFKKQDELILLNSKCEFIFSHTALGVGWDNSNIFQICFLRGIKKEDTMRQFIGRGLRLSKNQNGDRQKNDGENSLHVIGPKEFEDAFLKYFNDEEVDENNQSQQEKQKILYNYENNYFIKLSEQVKYKTKYFFCNDEDHKEFFSNLEKKNTYSH